MTSNSKRDTTRNTNYLETKEWAGEVISFSPVECHVTWQMPGTYHEHCLGPLLGWDAVAMEETIKCYNDLGCRYFKCQASDRYSA